MTNLRQTTASFDESVAFKLALGRANRTSVALCGGSISGFSKISRLYTIWHDLKIPVTLIVPARIKKYLPNGENVFLLDEGDKKTIHKAVEALESAGIVVIGPDMQMTSFEQIFFANYLTHSSSPLLLTEEALSLASLVDNLAQQESITWLVNLKNIQIVGATSQKITMSQLRRGVFGVHEYLQSLSVAANCLIALDAVNLYSYVRSSDTLVHSPAIGSTRQIQLLVTALMPITIAARTREVSSLDRVKLLHSLYDAIAKECIDDPSQWVRVIKQYLS